MCFNLWKYKKKIPWIGWSYCDVIQLNGEWLTIKTTDRLRHSSVIGPRPFCLFVREVLDSNPAIGICYLWGIIIEFHQSCVPIFPPVVNNILITVTCFGLFIGYYWLIPLCLSSNVWNRPTFTNVYYSHTLSWFCNKRQTKSRLWSENHDSHKDMMTEKSQNFIIEITQLITIEIIIINKCWESLQFIIIIRLLLKK